MKNETKVYVGMDVHKNTVMVAVLPEGAREPMPVRRAEDRALVKEGTKSSRGRSTSG